MQTWQRRGQGEVVICNVTFDQMIDGRSKPVVSSNQDSGSMKRAVLTRLKQQKCSVHCFVERSFFFMAKFGTAHAH